MFLQSVSVVKMQKSVSEIHSKIISLSIEFPAKFKSCLTFFLVKTQ